MTSDLVLTAAAQATTGGPGGVAVVLAVGGSLVAALVLGEVVGALVRALGKQSWLARNLSRRARVPLRVVLLVVSVWVALRVVLAGQTPGWRPVVEHVLLIALIIGGAWLIGSLAFVVEDAAVARYRTDVPDNRHARRVRTQVMVLRRLTVALLVVCAAAGVLLTFEGARAAGAGVLASAGLLSVVAGLAAQTSLANVFAGMQIAFTDAIRVDDVVVVDGEWGRIEEITMTYVVVHLWDDRRLILPSTRFATTPFENWTRRAADLLGTVELDVDWTVPVPAMRAELVRILQASELWDHRVGVLQVVDATGGLVRVRALASAVDAPTLFDLRCAVREGLVDWLQREHPGALPRSRWQADDGGVTDPATGTDPTAAPDPTTAPPTTTTTTAPTPAQAEPAVPLRRRAIPRSQDTVLLDPGRDSRLFTGSLAAVERSRAFSGPGEEVIAEREQTAEGIRRHHPPDAAR